MNQYPALTSLRFVAALVVFLFHFPPEGPLWDVVAGQGHVGVNIFFVLSGFLIALRYGEGFAQGRIRLSEYFLRRAARILPLYYVVLFLSLGLARTTPLSLALLPELTLTQALFGESVQHLVIPTSWSLTVEECFYASAPAVLLAVAAVRRRLSSRPLLATAGVLAAVTLVLFAAGAAIWTLLEGRGPGFLRSPDQVVRHTVFGRFYDFAVGAFAALAFARGGGGWMTRGRAALPCSLLGAALILVSQWGMHDAGGIDGPRWAWAWAWSVLLAPATALLIVSLTAADNPMARALGAGPLVYLGKVSYALYLVQLTPLGKGLFYRLTPHQGAATLAFLYVGITLVAIALYELVEEPARVGLLRLAGLERDAALPRRAAVWARAAGASALGLSLAVQCVAWAAASATSQAGPITLAELRAAGLRATDVHEVQDARRGRDVILAGIPRRWREGWRHDLRAPSGLHVFVHGEAVPFSRREPPGTHPAAFFRGPRAEHLALRVERVPADVVLVREWPATEARLRLARLARSASGGWTSVLLFGGLLVLAAAAAHLLDPRRSVGLALGSLTGAWMLELAHQPWGIAVVVLEAAGVLVLAWREPRRRGAARASEAAAVSCS